MIKVLKLRGGHFDRKEIREQSSHEIGLGAAEVRGRIAVYVLNLVLPIDDENAVLSRLGQGPILFLAGPDFFLRLLSVRNVVDDSLKVAVLEQA